MKPEEWRNKALAKVEKEERNDYVENFVRLFEAMKSEVDPLINQRIQLIDVIFEDPGRTFNDPELVELEKKQEFLGDQHEKKKKKIEKILRKNAERKRRRIEQDFEISSSPLGVLGMSVRTWKSIRTHVRRIASVRT